MKRKSAGPKTTHRPKPPRPRPLAQRKVKSLAYQRDLATKNPVQRTPVRTQPPPSKPAPSKPAPQPPKQLAAATEPANALRMRGEYWELTYGGRTAMVEDCRGLRYIALLVEQASAGRGPIHARELVALATGEAGPIELEMADPVLDAAARKQLLSRLEELAGDRDRAAAAGDFDRAAKLDDEYERIGSEVSRAAGPGKKHGASASFGHAGEKARKAVSKAISEAISRVASCRELAPLAEHFTSAVRKGQWLSYGGSEGWHVDFRIPPPRK